MTKQNTANMASSAPSSLSFGVAELARVQILGILANSATLILSVDETLVGQFTSHYTVQMDMEPIVEHSLRECGSGREANGSSRGEVCIDLLKQVEPPSRSACSTKNAVGCRAATFELAISFKSYHFVICYFPFTFYRCIFGISQLDRGRPIIMLMNQR